jgi:hypothetical protein
MSQILKNMQDSIDKLRSAISDYIKQQDKNNENIIKVNKFKDELNDIGYEPKVSIDGFSDRFTIKIFHQKDMPTNRRLPTRTINNLENFVYNKIKDSLPTQQEIIQNLNESIIELEKSNNYLEEEKDELLNTNLRNAISKVVLEDA